MNVTVETPVWNGPQCQKRVVMSSEGSYKKVVCHHKEVRVEMGKSKPKMVRDRIYEGKLCEYECTKILTKGRGL